MRERAGSSSVRLFLSSLKLVRGVAPAGENGYRGGSEWNATASWPLNAVVPPGGPGSGVVAFEQEMAILGTPFHEDW